MHDGSIVTFAGEGQLSAQLVSRESSGECSQMVGFAEKVSILLFQRPNLLSGLRHGFIKDVIMYLDFINDVIMYLAPMPIFCAT